MVELPASATAAWEPTNTSGAHANHWTSTNMGEAAPGVLTPLASSHWLTRIDRSAMESMYNIGVLSHEECFGPRVPAECAVRLFSGRIGCRLEYVTTIGERMPGVSGVSGVSGEEVLRSLLNKALDTVGYHPTRRRYPIIAAKLAHQCAVSHGRLRAISAQADRLWREHVDQVPQMDEAAPIAAVALGGRTYEDAISVQPTYDALDRLITSTDVGDISVLSGTGGAEMAVVGDAWRVSRGELTVEDVVRNHGFHGPREGEVASTVWREDDSPLRRVIEHYRDVPNEQSPMWSEAARVAQIGPMTSEVIASLSRTSIPPRSLSSNWPVNAFPTRGRGKRAYLQGIDITRMAARRLGRLWEQRGVLEQADDIFFLTEDEITGGLPAGVHEVVTFRREQMKTYQGLEFQEVYWRGEPEMVPLAEYSDGDRVAEDPTFEDVEPGEILVATTTDPSWCTIMFVSAALFVDLGGALSHAAVVARELGIPCVVNTAHGTRRLRIG